jgi:hypothetical protein
MVSIVLYAPTDVSATDIRCSLMRLIRLVGGVVEAPECILRASPPFIRQYRIHMLASATPMHVCLLQMKFLLKSSYGIIGLDWVTAVNTAKAQVLAGELPNESFTWADNEQHGIPTTKELCPSNTAQDYLAIHCVWAPSRAHKKRHNGGQSAE